MPAQTPPDASLMGVPSLRGVTAFLAAARYQSFTGAAGALCVTQAAVSKQVRELEAYLGVALFVRAGRTVTLTADGAAFRDAAQLSFINLLQATERLRQRRPVRRTLTVCCSPAFSLLWLQPRLPALLEAEPALELTVLATQNFSTLEGGVRPDVLIAKLPTPREGYDSAPLFDDVVFPVCSPDWLARHGPLQRPADLLGAALLDISPYGRAQVSEHIDWGVCLALHDVDAAAQQAAPPRQPYRSNDYPALVQLALAGQGVALGWQHLVGEHVARGALVRPLPQSLVLRRRGHQLAVRRERAGDADCARFCSWLRAQFADAGEAAPDNE